MTINESVIAETLPTRLREQMLATRNASTPDDGTTSSTQAGSRAFKDAHRIMVEAREDNVLDLSGLACRLAVTLEDSDTEAEHSDRHLTLATEPHCGVTFSLDETAKMVCLATATGAKSISLTQNIDGPLTRELIISLAQAIAEAFAKASKIQLPTSPVWKVQEAAENDRNPADRIVVLGISVPQKRSAALLKQEAETAVGRMTLNVGADLMDAETTDTPLATETAQEAILTSEIDLSFAVPARRMSLLTIGELQVGDLIGLPDDKLSAQASSKDGPLLEGRMVQLNGHDVFCVGNVLSASTSDMESHQ